MRARYQLITVKGATGILPYSIIAINNRDRPKIVLTADLNFDPAFWQHFYAPPLNLRYTPVLHQLNLEISVNAAACAKL